MIRVQRSSSAVTSIVLDQPPTNKLGPAEIVELGDALAEAQHAADVVAVLISGAGGDFCGGRVGSEATSRADLAREFHAVVRVGQLIDTMPQLVLVAVEGTAWGLGSGLSIQADVTVAASNASFCFPELSHGLPPLIVMSYLDRYVPYKVGLDWALTGRQIPVSEMLDLGVVTREADPGEALACAEQMAELAVRAGGRAVTQLKSYARAAARLFDHHESQRAVETISAFLAVADR